MKILTLLNANIRRKKGSFVSVILLTMIIAMSVTIILSIKESTLNGVNKAHEICDTPEVFAIYAEYNFQDNIIENGDVLPPLIEVGASRSSTLMSTVSTSEPRPSDGSHE